MQPDFRPIAEAQHVNLGTVADLRMASGRVYRATWEYRGHCCAWWPLAGQDRRKSIGLYDPVAFNVIAIGMTLPAEWRRAAEIGVFPGSLRFKWDWSGGSVCPEQPEHSRV